MNGHDLGNDRDDEFVVEDSIHDLPFLLPLSPFAEDHSLADCPPEVVDDLWHLLVNVHFVGLEKLLQKVGVDDFDEGILEDVPDGHIILGQLILRNVETVFVLLDAVLSLDGNIGFCKCIGISFDSIALLLKEAHILLQDPFGLCDETVVGKVRKESNYG